MEIPERMRHFQKGEVINPLVSCLIDTFSTIFIFFLQISLFNVFLTQILMLLFIVSRSLPSSHINAPRYLFTEVSPFPLYTYYAVTNSKQMLGTHSIINQHATVAASHNSSNFYAQSFFSH